MRRRSGGGDCVAQARDIALAEVALTVDEDRRRAPRTVSAAAQNISFDTVGEAMRLEDRTQLNSIARQWRLGAGTRAACLRYSGATAVALLFAWSLMQWNLLGWRM